MKKDKLILIVILILVGVGSMIYISLPKQPSQNLKEASKTMILAQKISKIS